MIYKAWIILHSNKIQYMWQVNLKNLSFYTVTDFSFWSSFSSSSSFSLLFDFFFLFLWFWLFSNFTSVPLYFLLFVNVSCAFLSSCCGDFLLSWCCCCLGHGFHRAMISMWINTVPTWALAAAKPVWSLLFAPSFYCSVSWTFFWIFSSITGLLFLRSPSL